MGPKKNQIKFNLKMLKNKIHFYFFKVKIQDPHLLLKKPFGI